MQIYTVNINSAVQDWLRHNLAYNRLTLEFLNLRGQASEVPSVEIERHSRNETYLSRKLNYSGAGGIISDILDIDRQLLANYRNSLNKLLLFRMLNLRHDCRT